MKSDKDNFVDHSNRVVVITGASGMLGEELCQKYISLGAKVVGIDLKLSSETLDGLKDFSFVSLDIRSAEDVQMCFDKVIEEHGRLDVLVNNAGIASFDHYLQRSERDFDEVMDVNLKGTFNCIRAFISCSSSDFGGRCIVNLGSIYGIVSPDFRVYGDGDRRSPEVYGAAKAGIIQLTKYFAVDAAEIGIRVNAVSPGGIFNERQPQSSGFLEKYCERTPMRRMANYSEVVNAIVFLTSHSASYITGHNLVVDGGYSVL